MLNITRTLHQSEQRQIICGWFCEILTVCLMDIDECVGVEFVQACSGISLAVFIISLLHILIHSKS